MNKTIAAIVLSLLSLTASAERADSLKQAEIEFDSSDIDSVTGVHTVWGNVVLTRGTLALTSDRAIVKETPEGYMHVTLIANGGKVATFRQKRDGAHNLWIEGQAERIEYDERGEVVQLHSQAVVSELENGKVSKQVAAPYIAYDNRTEKYKTRNEENGADRRGAGRGKMIFEARRKAGGA